MDPNLYITPKRQKLYINWLMCIRCQTKKDEKLIEAKDVQLKTLHEAADVRQDIVTERLKCKNEDEKVLWHSNCYKSYTFLCHKSACRQQ